MSFVGKWITRIVIAVALMAAVPAPSRMHTPNAWPPSPQRMRF